MEVEQISRGGGIGLVKKIGYLSAVAVIVGGCAVPRTQYTPYPIAGKSAIEYNTDIAVCQTWASSQSGASSQRALNEGAQGAVIFGLLGAALGALAGDARLGGLAGASIGAIGGGIRGSQQAQTTYNMAYSDCLRKKGY